MMILVPLDFSDHAQRALTCALELAEPLQARLTLLHVIHLPAPGEVDVAGYLSAVEAVARQGLATALQRVRQAGIEAHSRLVHGVPWQQIVDTARALPADLIVMATHGRTGLQHALIGSVTERVVRHAPCPVLVVPLRAAGAQAGA
ncbi:MAG: universal stress protein [Candidatus Tectimicrobiota bacterium]|nr:MAG: universal stress protein [Candidatus Tectomicrobia bacterium]